MFLKRLIGGVGEVSDFSISVIAGLGRRSGSVRPYGEITDFTDYADRPSGSCERCCASKRCPIAEVDRQPSDGTALLREQHRAEGLTHDQTSVWEESRSQSARLLL